MRVLIGTVITLCVLFLITFLILDGSGILAEATISARFNALLASPGASILVPFVITLALTLDLVLPIPSSLLMMLAGHFSGVVLGTVTGFVGSMGSALLGFWLCRRFGQAAFWRLVGSGDTARVERFVHRYGDWAVLLSRVVPILAETVSCVSGLSRMSARRFAALAAVATLPMCAVYAWAGRYLGTGGAVGVPLLVAFVLPAVAWAFVARRLSRPTEPAPADRPGPDAA